MKHFSSPMRVGVLSVAALAGGLVFMNLENNKSSAAESAAVQTSNPLLAKWTGPYDGVPPFDKVKVSDFKPALEAAMAEQLAEIERITSNKEAPTFENTIEAMEATGSSLDRIVSIYGVWGSNLNTPDFQKVEAEMDPKLAAFQDKITQNEALFKRIEAVYNSPDKAKLTPEQQRLTWRYYTNFVRSGAKLDASAKAKLSEINQKLATSFTKFSQNLLADESEPFLELKTDADLAGLPQSLRDAYAEEAKRRKLTGVVGAVANTRSSIEPFLTYSTRRDLRERAFDLFANRGDNGDKNDNNQVISEILQLRAERAKLLGFPTHAHWRVDNTMAKTPERTMELMEAVWKPAVARVKEEVADMQALADKEGAKITIEPWDYRFYAEKVRKAKYDIDQNEVKPYLQLDKMRDAMFWMAGELFNFNFKRVNNVPVFHPDVEVWDVTDKTSGKHVGLFYFDPFARPGKRSGAWMTSYRSQQRMGGKDVTTLVSNNSNFIKGKPGEAVLISWDDATTLFHEFGHALHGLSSNTTYPSVSGTNTARDFVEFPSQILEHWVSTPQILQKYAVHYETGKPIPQELVDKITRASKFNQGFATVEYLASALVDMKLHLAGGAKIDIDKFERETLASIGMPREIVMRHRLPQFGHLFSSDSYSAGYYSYLWSDVLNADAFEAFTEAAGPYDRKVAEKLRKHIFSVGDTIDPAETYRNFRGRDPRVEALMRKRGFPAN
ncbi:MAG: M3 family metallopeptidase [Pyrinomonadaceae bacterium]|nr:M3 family metallopeptidase [Pyrinomonadaceae bacterium]